MKVRLVACTVLSLALGFRGSISTAGEVEILRRWSFESPDDLKGWRTGRGISGLRVSGGRLRGKLTHTDAYLFAPPLELPLDGVRLRVRWSCPRGGSGQCYFTTRESPAMGEDKVISQQVPGGSRTFWISSSKGKRFSSSL